MCCWFINMFCLCMHPYYEPFGSILWGLVVWLWVQKTPRAGRARRKQCLLDMRKASRCGTIATVPDGVAVLAHVWLIVAKDGPQWGRAQARRHSITWAITRPHCPASSPHFPSPSVTANVFRPVTPPACQTAPD